MYPTICRFEPVTVRGERQKTQSYFSLAPAVIAAYSRHMNNPRFNLVMSKRLRQQVADVATELEMTAGQVVRLGVAYWMAQGAPLGRGGIAELARGPRRGRPPQRAQKARRESAGLAIRPE
jgi:hypothetical protein